MSILHQSEMDKAIAAYQNIKRLKALGYGDSRVTGLTTVDSLVSDIETFRALKSVHQSARQICDAAIESVRWMAAADLLNTTIVTGLTTVATDGTAATTDLSYNAWGVTGFPTTQFPRTANDITNIIPICS